MWYASAISWLLLLIDKGGGRDTLASQLSNNDFDWVVITSPEAAGVFLQCWEQAGQPQVWTRGHPFEL